MLEAMLAFWREPLSSDSTTRHGDEDASPLSEFFRAETPQPDQVAADNQRDAVLRECLAELDEREIDIVCCVYGIPRRGHSTREMQLTEAGKRWNITRERARQIRRSALVKLRTALEERGITSSMTDDAVPDETAVDERRQLARTLRNQGLSFDGIAQRLGIGKSDVMYFCEGMRSEEHIRRLRKIRQREWKARRRGDRE